AADRIEVEGLVTDLLDISFRHDRKLDELRQQHGVGGFGLYLDLRGPDHLRIRDRIELPELGALELRIDHALDAEDDVLRRQRCSVLELHAAANVELEGRIVDVAPGGGDLRNDLA